VSRFASRLIEKEKEKAEERKSEMQREGAGPGEGGSKNEGVAGAVTNIETRCLDFIKKNKTALKNFYVAAV
jgi:hypothetical protein